MYICDGYVGRQVSMAYVTKRKIALPDAKRDPEMGQLNSPWPTYGGSANYTVGLYGTDWPLHMGAGHVCLGHACERSHLLIMYTRWRT